MKEEALKLLLQHKLAFLGIAAQVLMLWWVSAVAFSASILAAFWLKRDDFATMPALHYRLIILTVTIFFASLIVFGAWSVWSLHLLQMEATDLIARMTAERAAISEFAGVKWAVVIGTTSFVFVFITWLTLCWHVERLRRGSADPA